MFSPSRAPRLPPLPGSVSSNLGVFGHDASAEVQSVVAGAGAELKIDQKPLQDITDTRPINYPPCLFLNEFLGRTVFHQG